MNALKFLTEPIANKQNKITHRLRSNNSNMGIHTNKSSKHSLEAYRKRKIKILSTTHELVNNPKKHYICKYEMFERDFLSCYCCNYPTHDTHLIQTHASTTYVRTCWLTSSHIRTCNPWQSHLYSPANITNPQIFDHIIYFQIKERNLAKITYTNQEKPKYNFSKSIKN